uniref:Uncharacterized protein n=1 Tax=Parastrongyloides trichosuri TaxID=131310 RepID=A0A0N4Z7Z7_PARTI
MIFNKPSLPILENSEEFNNVELSNFDYDEDKSSSLFKKIINPENILVLILFIFGFFIIFLILSICLLCYCKLSKIKRKDTSSSNVLRVQGNFIHENNCSDTDNSLHSLCLERPLTPRAESFRRNSAQAHYRLLIQSKFDQEYGPYREQVYRDMEGCEDIIDDSKNYLRKFSRALGL